MSDAGSEGEPGPAPFVPAPFVEDDARRTELPYDRGGVPLYIALAWVTFIVTYVAVMAWIALPDLRAWMAR